MAGIRRDQELARRIVRPGAAPGEFRPADDLAAKFPEWLNNLADFVRDRWPKVVEFTQTNPLGQRIRGVLISHQEALFKGFRQWAEQPFQ